MFSSQGSQTEASRDPAQGRVEEASDMTDDEWITSQVRQATWRRSYRRRRAMLSWAGRLLHRGHLGHGGRRVSG